MMKSLETWKEKILAAMTGRNKRGIPLWYSHDQILKLLSKQQGRDVSKVYRSLSAYLLALVKSGHLERAVKPRHLSRKVTYDGKPEYLYRVTGKPFKQFLQRLRSNKNQHSPLAHRNAVLAHELWRRYPQFPKWFRRMMLD